KENSTHKTGLVFVRTTGCKPDGSKVLEYVRWVMVNKRDEAATTAPDHVPRVQESLLPSMLGDACPPIDLAVYGVVLSGTPHRFGDYQVGEKIDHGDGITVEEAEHQIASRLYQNPARIHFNEYVEAHGRFGRRLIYGGHVISLARTLTFNGFAHAFHVTAINGGPPPGPLFSGGAPFPLDARLPHGPAPRPHPFGRPRPRP